MKLCIRSIGPGADWAVVSAVFAILSAAQLIQEFHRSTGSAIGREVVLCTNGVCSQWLAAWTESQRKMRSPADPHSKPASSGRSLECSGPFCACIWPSRGMWTSKGSSRRSRYSMQPFTTLIQVQKPRCCRKERQTHVTEVFEAYLLC